MATIEKQLKEGCEILMQAAAPDIYRINAFRISGLNVNATTREISNQIQKNQMLEKYGGKLVNHKSPFPIEPLPDIDKLRQALHRLRDPETRIIDEFFWFWPHNLDNEVKDNALESLARNDIKTAESLWINYEATLTESNVSRHNLAVLSHLLVLDIELNGLSLKEDDLKLRDKYWKDTFKRWKLLLEHEGFWSRLTARVRQMDDPRLTTGFVKRLRESLPYAIIQINASLALKAAEVGNKKEASRQISLMNGSGFGKEVTSAALKHVTKPLRNRIKSICKSYSDEIYSDKKNELDACKKLIDNTKELLDTIDILLPQDNTIREGAHDEVALSGTSMAISYANDTEDWESVLPIFEELRKIVIGESAKNRVERNFEIFTKNIEFDRLYNTCFFCQENKSSDRSNVKVKMHGNVRTEYEYYPYTRLVTKWNYNTFEVPRCEKCEKLHAGKSGEHKKEYLKEKEKHSVEIQKYKEERKKFKELNRPFSHRNSLIFILNLAYLIFYIILIIRIPDFWILISIVISLLIMMSNFFIVKNYKNKINPILDKHNKQKVVLKERKTKMLKIEKKMNSYKSRPYSDYALFPTIKEKLNQGWTWGERPSEN